MTILDQSDIHEAYRTYYGGSDNTAPSFLRPQYVKYNSLLKSRDFGPQDNLLADISGQVGGQSGAATLFFRVETTAPSRLVIEPVPINAYTDRYLQYGICDGEHDPIPLDEDGAARVSEVHNSTEEARTDLLPRGAYFFTVSCSQWQSTPFAATIRITQYRELIGAAVQQMIPRLRLALVKLSGPALMTAPLTGALRPPSTVKRLSGAATQLMDPRLTLVIRMRGVALLTMPAYGRLIQNWKISGAATGTSPSVATITVSRPYGYGY